MKMNLRLQSTMPVQIDRGTVEIGGKQLQRGSPLECVQIGPVYGRANGEELFIFTPDVVSALAALLNRRAADSLVPIDWNHGTYEGGPPAESMNLGVVEPGTAAVSGDSLYVTPLWGPAGLKVIEDAAVLYVSVEIAGPAFDKTTGELLSDIEVIAIALTPTPALPGLEPVSLSDRPTVEVIMAKNKSAPGRQNADAPVPPTDQAPPEDQAPAEPTPEEQIATLEAENAALKEQIAQLEADLAAAKEAAGAAPGDAAALSDARTRTRTLLAEVKALTERVTASEAREKAAEKARRFSELLHTGRISPAEREHASKVFDLDVELFASMYEARAAGFSVPLGEQGHALDIDTPTDPKVFAEQKAGEWKVSFTEAVLRLEKEGHPLFKEATR